MKNKLKLLALAALAVTSIASQAGTATATLNTTLTIAAQCSFSAANYSVSASGVANTKPTQTTSITYTCASGMSPTLTANPPTTTDGSGNTIGVDVYSDSGYTNVVEDDNPLTLVASGSATTIPLYLKFQGQGGANIVTPGTYNFAIPLTINY